MKTAERFEYFFWGCLISGAVYVALRVIGLEDVVARAALDAVAMAARKFRYFGLILMAMAVSSAPFLPGIVKMIVAPLVNRFNNQLSPDFEKELKRVYENMLNAEFEKNEEKIRCYGQKDRDRHMSHAHRLEELLRLKVSLEQEISKLAKISQKYDEATAQILAQPVVPAGAQKANHLARIAKQKTNAMDEMNQALNKSKGVVDKTPPQ